MGSEQKTVTAGRSDRGAAVVGRALYPLAPLRVVSISSEEGRVPSWMEPDPAWAGAVISVWWDYPPS
jgi:hypothetical protein